MHTFDVARVPSACSGGRAGQVHTVNGPEQHRRCGTHLRVRARTDARRHSWAFCNAMRVKGEVGAQDSLASRSFSVLEAYTCVGL